MRVWFDIITPKQARLMTSIAKWLGHEYLITSKRLNESTDLLKKLNVRFLGIGRYATEGLKDKLLAYSERVKLLLNIALDFKPDVLISFSSPEAVRVAFGLSIKALTMNDSPHSYHVGRLALPLSWRVVYPEAIPKLDMIRLGTSQSALVPYKGVDEVAWVKDFLRNKNHYERGYTVFIRLEENRASYLLGKESSISAALIDEIIGMGAKVLVKPRYPYQYQALRGRYKGKIVLIKDTVDTLQLFSKLSLVITGGGTMAREAALLGTPSISTFPLNIKLYVNDYLEERGFPIWRAHSLEEAKELVGRILRDPDAFFIDTSKKINELEDPRIVIGRVLGELSR